MCLLRVELGRKRVGRAITSGQSRGSERRFGCRQRRLRYLHRPLFVHFWPLSQSRSLLHSTHSFFTQNSFLLQSVLFWHFRTHLFFLQIEPPLQFRSLLHSTHFLL